MEKLMITCTALMFINVGHATLRDNEYLEVMQRCIRELYHTSDIMQLQETVNTLEKVSSAQPAKWEPSYYISFGYIMMATRETSGKTKDAYLDHAMTAIEKAKALMPGDADITALEGFIYMMRITVDPETRGQALAPLAMKTFEKATLLDPENPRALALTAQMVYGTAQFFGSSTAEACSLVKRALENFKAERPKSPLSPVWGKSMAERLLTECK